MVDAEKELTEFAEATAEALGMDDAEYVDASAA